MTSRGPWRKREFIVPAISHPEQPADLTRHPSGTFSGFDQQPQQTGMLLIIRQQVQPHFVIDVIHAQHASIIAQHVGSPLVQVTQTPSSVGSHLHMAIVKL
jgi:hypothetical protein